MSSLSQLSNLFQQVNRKINRAFHSISAKERISDRSFLANTYRQVLGREIDSNRFAHYSNLLKNGLSRTDVLMELLQSEEYRERPPKENSDKLTTISNESFLKLAYKTIFEREIDREGLEHWLHQLNTGLSRTALIRTLIESVEFQLRPLSDEDCARLLGSKLHHARFKLIRTVLPPAKVILDLGGTSTGDSRGALLNFGYPHSPEKLYIVDLPPDERMLTAAERSQHVKYQNCDIEYVYASMADLSCFAEGTFDLIWSGQSIEHVTQAEAKKVFSQAYKLLKPGGKLALDTPNRTATQIQYPDSYIHPEHKIEYYYKDLCQLLEKYNFKIVDARGLIDLSKTIETSDISGFANEFVNSENLNSKPETSYCFYICCMRDIDI